MGELTVFDHLVALVAGVLLPLIAAARGWAARTGEPIDLAPGETVGVYWVNAAVLVVLGSLAVLAWRGGGHDLAALGLAPPAGRLAAAAALALVFVVWLTWEIWRDVATPARRRRARARLARDVPFMPRDERQLAHFAVLALAASISEEILFRGYLIRYLLALAGETPLGVAVAVGLPALVFALAHLYQGREAVFKIAIMSVLLGAIFVVTGSLVVPMVLHCVTDLASGGATVCLERGRGAAGEQERSEA